MGKIEGRFSNNIYQWILNFVEMSWEITRNSRIKNLIISSLINEYNSLHSGEDDAIKETQYEMQFSVLSENINFEIFTMKHVPALAVKGQNFKYSIHDDITIYAQTWEFQSLIILAEQHRQLPIIKLKQITYLDTINKSLRKNTSGIHGEEMHAKFYIPMYYEIFEEICEYVIWSKFYADKTQKPIKPVERFYQGNTKKYIPDEFVLFELGISNVSLNILFTETLVYLFRFEDVENMSNSVISTPYVFF